MWRRLSYATAWKSNSAWLAQAAAGLHLLGLGLIATLGWHDPVTTGASTTLAGVPALHLGFLMATGAAAALLTLGNRHERHAPTADVETQTGNGVNQLLAQMSHELRTPLNAMIGFSDVMLRELHGPLGHARYQEYAAHINESGGRLLKSSEDTLAVAATMSALMANRPGFRRQRVLASTLLRQAWGTAVAGASDRAIELAVLNCNSCEIECERRATEQAIEHLLREAIAQTPAGGQVEVKGRRRGGARSIEIRIKGAAGRPDETMPADAARQDQGPYPIAGDSLRVILARLLLEMQGATISLWDDDAGLWSACVAFPPRG